MEVQPPKPPPPIPITKVRLGQGSMMPSSLQKQHKISWLPRQSPGLLLGLWSLKSVSIYLYSLAIYRGAPLDLCLISGGL